jgi:tetratricopeptide (TPR) repeat protein
MKKVYAILFTFSSFYFAQAQVEDESCLPPDKKVLKILESASKSVDYKQSSVQFNEAKLAAPDNAMVYYDFAMYTYNVGLKHYESQPNPDMGDRSFLKAEELFAKALELCPDYHANCSYYLGVINYTQEDKPEALKWFKVFTAYKNSDNSKYPEDYDKKMSDVKEVVKEMENQVQLISEKVPFVPMLVKNVSSDKDEYFPMISPDNELIFYTRKVNRANLGDLVSNIVEEFTFSQRADFFADFNGGEPLKKPFNDGMFSNYGAATLSVDNKEMIICACKKEQV